MVGRSQICAAVARFGCLENLPFVDWWQAWAVLESCQGVLGDLHEAGADAALWHAAAGVALYHSENLQVAKMLTQK
jgi:hypothetical protein